MVNHPPAQALIMGALVNVVDRHRDEVEAEAPAAGGKHDQGGDVERGAER
jgi:hypothetical protein